ncbi:IclR family transcriptional regulator [Amycolatopsis pithecellobii]|uniref:IclR family transcriptional regulator n=1 Tax=Amycolatopsis pithecellobii TaxID=664692 RepID=UPI00140DDDE1|nr:IclR family transcriptional regulator [Amycolatopsis pithecellobii]
MSELESEAPAREGKYVVQSVARCLRLLELLGTHTADGLSVTEAARLLGGSKSATFALLQTLIVDDFVVEVSPGPRYRLGPAILRLADSHVRSLPLIEAVRPVMRALTTETGWTSRLAVFEHGHAVFMDRVDAGGTIRFFTPLGRRELPHRSSAGKAMLATLPETQVRAIIAETGLPQRTRQTITNLDALMEDLALIRVRGFAVDDEEDDEGVLCVGAAFADRDGTCAAAVSITGLKSGVPAWRIQELGRLVRAHADRMAEVIGGQPGHPYAAPGNGAAG